MDTERASRRLFVSYARKDRETLQPLLDGIERLNVTAWVDRRLEGGQSWWDEILAQIRGCHALLVPISPALLTSEACTSERNYGRALAKPILPVVIRPVSMNTLPSDLARLQIVDYTKPGVEAAFELAGALSALPPPPALPDPLPEPPGIPKSYQYDLADRVQVHSLSLEEQLALIAELRGFISRPDDHEWALELLMGMQARRDLYKAADREITEILERVPKEVPETSVPAGWYDDPSRRHQLRWFDKDWTSWAADGEVVVEDPLS